MNAIMETCTAQLVTYYRKLKARPCIRVTIAGKLLKLRERDLVVQQQQHLQQLQSFPSLVFVCTLYPQRPNHSYPKWTLGTHVCQRSNIHTIIATPGKREIVDHWGIRYNGATSGNGGYKLTIVDPWFLTKWRERRGSSHVVPGEIGLLSSNYLPLDTLLSRGSFAKTQGSSSQHKWIIYSGISQ